MPAQLLVYGSALLAIATIGGATLPEGLGILATTVGANILTDMLNRVAKGDDIPEDVIRKTVEDAIRESGIESQANIHDIQREIAHLFRQLDLINYAIQKGESSVVDILTEKFSHFGLTLQELRNDVASIHEQTTETLNIVRDFAEAQKSVSISSQSPALRNYPTALVDQKTEDEIDVLRKSRFFREFDLVGYSLSLAKKVVEGDFSGGTKLVRSRALGWCARVLSCTKELLKAEEYLQLGKSLGANSEILIAEAFISSQRGDKSSAFKYTC